MTIQRLFAVLIMGAHILRTLPLSAQGDFFLSPTRVVFDGHNLTEEVLLLNTGADTATFTASFVEYHIDEFGNYTPVTLLAEDGFYASRYVRIFPRKFTLAPNATQTMRLQYVRRPGMREGEYRSHLYFRMEAGDQLRALEQRLAANGGNIGQEGLNVRLIPVYGVTIPVIIREGTLSADAEISDVRLDVGADGQPLLEFTILRSGDKSAYGDLTVDYIGADQQVVNVLTWKGFSIYTSAERRKCSVPISRQTILDLRQGTLLIRYGLPDQTGAAMASVPVRLP